MSPTDDGIQQEAIFGIGKPKEPANFRYTSPEQLKNAVDDIVSERGMGSYIARRLSAENINSLIRGDESAKFALDQVLDEYETRIRNLSRDINTAAQLGWWEEGNLGYSLRLRLESVQQRMQYLREDPKEFLRMNAYAKKISILTTDSANGKKQSSAWTAGIFSEAKSPKGLDTFLTETALGKVDKHDVVDVGRRDKDIEDTTEKQLDKEHKYDSKKQKAQELQLDKVRVKKPVEVTTEVKLEKKHRPKASEGDKIKMSEDNDEQEKKRDKANKAFQKSDK